MKYTKAIFAYLSGLALIVACQSEDENLASLVQTPELEQVQPIPRSEIDKIIMETVQAGQEFNWNTASDHMLWSALVHGDSIITVGYAQSGNVAFRMGDLDMSDPTWQAAKDQVIRETLDLLSSRQGRRIELEEVPHRASAHLPYVDMKVYDLAVIRELRQQTNVRYLEPTGYEIDLGPYITDPNANELYSSSGCSNDPNFNIPTSDYTVVSPNAKASWHYDYHGIRQAWNIARGEGITVGVIDTGLSPAQAKMNGLFASGESTGRNVERYGFHQSGMWWWKAYDGPDDGCGHGTAMAGVIAAPKSSGGSSVGVAWKANLISTRGTEDVIINSGSEKDGVAEALVFLGNRPDVRVISMSIGDVFSNGKVADAIRYAHARGKLIFAAAGTSTSFTNWYGVIFPASMNETVAVTGIKEGQGYQRCNTCHSGGKVDFTIVMERAGTNNHALTTAMSGDVPATVGGSSVATATAAGIAAVVWSKNPNWTRQQVLDRLTRTADLYPNRSGQFGWGNLNANAALSDVIARY